MLTSLLSAIPAEEALIRLAATALIIIVVTWSVELFGPMIGGVLAGLPITLGPGFYFLVDQAPAPFVAQAASSSGVNWPTTFSAGFAGYHFKPEKFLRSGAF